MTEWPAAGETQPDEAVPAGARVGPVRAPRAGPAALVGLVGLVLVKAAYYESLGPALILDDWRLINNTQVYGVFDTLHGGHDSVSRPIAWLLFNVVYGAVGTPASRLLVVVTALNLAIVVVLFLLLRRWLPAHLAFAVVAVWVVLPTHTALSVWGGSIQAQLCLVLFLGGVLAVAKGRWLVAALLLVGSALSYQMAIPLSLLAALIVPAEGDLRWVDRAKIIGAVLLAALWVTAHPTYPPHYEVPDVLWLWRAHFGTGLFVSNDVPVAARTGLAVLVLVGVIVAVILWLRGRRSWDQGPSLVVAGMVVWAGGLVVLVSLPVWVGVPEFGIVDRLFGLSSVGSSLVFVGLGVMVWRRFPPALVGAGLAFGLVVLSGQYVALNAWSDAGHDAWALLLHLGQRAEAPRLTSYLVGPDYPSRNGVVSLDSDSVYFAHKAVYGGGPGLVTFFTDPETPIDPAQVFVWWGSVSGDLPAQFYEPVVRIDPVAVDPSTIHVSGWAVDRTTARPVAVRLYLDDDAEPVATIDRADLDRPGLDARFGLSDRHGYDIDFENPGLDPGRHRLCGRGIGPATRVEVDPPSLYCVAMTVPADGSAVGPDAPNSAPLGSLDVVEPAADGVRVVGWAVDGSTDEPVTVQFFLDGSTVPYGTVAASLPRPDLAPYGLGVDHGFDAVIAGAPLATGRHRLCLSAVADDGPDTAIAQHCLTVTAP